MKPNGPPRWRALAGLAVLGSVIFVLHWAARFELEGPAGWGSDALEAWLADPAIVIATVARWLALGLAYYLSSLMLMIAITADPERIARIVPSGLIGPLAAALGVAIVVTPIVASRAPEPTPLEPASAPLSLRPLSPPLTLGREGFDPDPPPTMQSADGDAETAVLRGAGDGSNAVVVQPGDSFWSLACDELIDAWGRPVTAEEIVPYWRELIARNRNRLVEPGNPDLILPGQRFELPAVPPEPLG